MQAVRSLVVTTVVVLSQLGAVAAAEEDVRLNFQVPAMAADKAVKRFAVQSKRSVLFRADDIKDVQTNALQGEFSVKEGLEQLFDGTPLSGNLTKKGTIIVSEKQVEETNGEMFEKTKKIVPMTSAVALMIGANGYAQDANEPVEVIEVEVAESEAAEEEFVMATEEDLMFLDQVEVTGSRLQSAYLNGANPITSIDIDDLRNTGRLNLTDALKRIPALNQTDPSPTNTTARNQSFLNLRGLGAGRTLTLVNGNRFVPGVAGSSGVDVNAISPALIERVDVATGGMSAVYGADAVSGVVNFVLRDDFEGINIRGQHGAGLEHWDGQETQFSILAGTNFHDDRGNITASYSITDSQEIPTANRDYLNEGYFGLVGNPSINGPDSIYAPNPLTIGVSRSPVGAVIPFAFDNNFDIVAIHGDGSLFDASTNPREADLLPVNIIEPFEVQNLALTANYDVSDSFRPFVNVYYSESESTNQRTDVDMNGIIFDSFSEPFLSPDVNNNFFLFGFDSYFRTDSGADLPRTKDRAESLQTFVGAKGDITDWLRYEITAGYGQTTTTNTATVLDGLRFGAATFLTTDINGDPVCADDTVAGCVPFNVFVRDTAVNGAARDWMFRRGAIEQENDQVSLNGFVSGYIPSLPFSLQGGEIEYVLGAEYREETYAVNIDAAREFGDSGLPTQLDGSPELSSTDIFGELVFPIFFDYGPGMHELNLQLAGRVTDQNVTGKDETYNLGLTWAPSQDVKFRTSFSRAVRAPGLFELFDPGFTIENFLLFDPCDDIRRTLQGSPNRAANCQALLEGLGLSAADAANYNLERDTDFFGFYEPGNLELGAGFSEVNEVLGGNENLSPEIGETFTVGMVFEPTFIEGLFASVDYYEIELTDAIDTLSPNFILSECVDLPSINNSLCGLVTRDPTTGFPTSIDATQLNVGKLETSGVDFAISYDGIETSWGEWGVSLGVSYVDSLLFQTTPSPDSITDVLGVTDLDTQALAPTPEWSGNLGVSWNKGKWDAGANVNYQEGVLRVFDGNQNRSIAETIQAAPYLEDLYNVSLNVGYEMNDGLKFFAGMDNALNDEPTIGENFLPTGVNGRTVYFGFDLTLDSIPGLK